MSFLSVSRSHVDLEKVSIVIPAYNEAFCIKETIRAIEEAINRLGVPYEIIIAEDGARDRTDIIVEELAVENSSILHLHSDERLGKGGSLKRALGVAQGELVIYMDVDLATSLNNLSDIFELIGCGYDMAIGSRNIKGSKVKRPLSRAIASIAYNFLIRLLFKDGIYDHQCGFKGFRRKVYESIAEDIESNDFLFDTELLVRTKRGGFSIAEFPVVWAEPEGRLSKVQLLRDGVRMGLQLLKLRVNLWRH